MRKTNNTFYCFSPPVMLATFIIEFGLLAFSLWRYRLTAVSKLVCLMLLCLGVFQVSEYMLCGGLGISGYDWARFGYVTITLLPPLGLHLAVVLSGKKIRWLPLTGYASAAVFIYFLVFVAGALYAHECRSNYVVFNVQDNLVDFYTTYYFGWLAITVSLSLWWSRVSKNARALKFLALAYMVFIIPSALATIIDPSAISGIPSIMCGFAIFTALILVGFVLPGAAKKRAK